MRTLNSTYKNGKKFTIIKLLYVVYSSVKEVRCELSEFPSYFRKYVYIDNIKKHLKYQEEFR